MSEALARLLKTDVRLSPPEGSADLLPPSPPTDNEPPQPPLAWLLQNTLVNYVFVDNRCVFWTTDLAGPVKCGAMGQTFHCTCAYDLGSCLFAPKICSLKPRQARIPWGRRQDAACLRKRRGCWLKPKMRAPRRSHCPSLRSGERANPYPSRIT